MQTTVPRSLVVPDEIESKLQAAALLEAGGGTVVRVQRSGDGEQTYEVRVICRDGTPVTVHIGEDFDVVSVERR